MFNSSHKAPKAQQSRSKGFDADRWDHGGFDQLQADLQTSEDSRRQRKYFPGSGQTPESTKSGTGSVQDPTSVSRWAHDKYENEVLTDKNFTPKEDQGRVRKEKRPDKALYSVRDKHAQSGDSASKQGSRTSQKLNLDLTSQKKEIVCIEDRDVQPFEDDISNVSTAISERRPFDDDVSILKDIKVEAPTDKTPTLKKGKGQMILEVVLENEQTDIVRIYDNEEDYGQFLENMCHKYGINGDLALHLKIYLAKLIRNAHPEPARISGVLDQLLILNYKLMFSEPLKKSESTFDDSLEDLGDIVSSHPEWEESH